VFSKNNLFFGGLKSIIIIMFGGETNQPIDLPIDH